MDTDNYANQKLQNKKSFKQAPFSQVHAHIYWALVLGQFTCAYTLGIAGEAFAEAQHSLNLTDTWLGLLGAGSLMGLAGSFLIGRLADKIGRKQLLMGNMYVFALLSLLQGFITNPLGLFLLRIGLGLMMAIDYTVGNTLLIEWLPDRHATRKQSYLLLYWAFGFAASFVVANLVPNWKMALCSSALLSLITAVYRTCVQIPASPAWLATHGKPKTAQKIIHKRLGKKWRLPKSLLSFKQTKMPSWLALFNRNNWRATLVGSAFYATQSFAFFGIGIFLPILLANMGINNSLLSGSLYDLAIIAGTALGIALFNRLPRRVFINITFSISTLCLFVMAGGQHLPTLMLMLVFILFSVVLSISLLLDFGYTTELFSVKIRATGVGFVIMMSRVGAAAGTFLLPIIVKNYGAYTTMLVCGVVLLLGTVICMLFAPETNPEYK